MTPTPTPFDTSVQFRHRVRFTVAVVTAVVGALFVVWTTRQAILLGFLGVALGVLFYHVSRWLTEKTGLPRWATLALVLIVVLAGIGAAAFFGVPTLAREGQDLAAQAPAVLERTQERLGLPANAFQLPSNTGDLVGRALGVFSTLAGVVTAVLVVFIVGAYTAAAPARYTSAFVRLFDRPHQPFIRRVLERMEHTLLGWLRGVAIAVAVLGVMAVVGLTALGLPGALALAAFAAVLTVIPTFGPIIGWLPAVVVGFASGTTTGLWTLGLAVVAQQIEGSVITPKVQGSMVSVGPAFIVAGQIVLGAIAGFLGVLLVVPILGIALILIQELYIGPFVEDEPADPDDRDHPAEGVMDGATALATEPAPAARAAR